MSTADRLEDLQAEQAVLGAMLIDGGCISAVAQRLREEDFVLPEDRTIFRTLAAMDREGRPVDGLTAADALGASGELRAYLAQLMELTPTSANVLEYARIVAERAGRRTLRTALAGALEALDRGASPAEAAAGLEGALSGGEREELLGPREQLERFWRHRERIDGGGPPCVPTGLRQLDALLGGGLMKTGLYFLAGRPGMGKTALALAVAQHAAAEGRETVFVSMEMSAEQLTARRAAALTGVDSAALLTGQLDEEQYRRVAEASRVLAAAPLYVTAGRAWAPEALAAMLRTRRGCGLVVVDHFSLFLLPGRQAAHLEYAAAAHALKRLAQAADAPVLCLAQLNRENEQRPDRRPRLSDLRATGAAEEDADGVILLYREDYYAPDFSRRPGEPVRVEAMLAKNRHGPTGAVDLSFWPETNTFRERRVS